jgi:hypothetical protein
VRRRQQQQQQQACSLVLYRHVLYHLVLYRLAHQVYRLSSTQCQVSSRHLTSTQCQLTHQQQQYQARLLQVCQGQQHLVTLLLLLLRLLLLPLQLGRQPLVPQVLLSQAGHRSSLLLLLLLLLLHLRDSRQCSRRAPQVQHQQQQQRCLTLTMLCHSSRSSQVHHLQGTTTILRHLRQHQQQHQHQHKLLHQQQQGSVQQ